jgi:CheY-like chemotaxis protein
LCGRLRQLDAYRKAPIIMLTAMSERDYMDSAFKAGATDCVTKPFDIAELGARLRVAQELCDARRETRAARAAQWETDAGTARQHGFDLSDPDPVQGLTGLVDFLALRNYLKQISHAGAAASQVIAVKIHRIEDIYARATSDEFSYVLGEVTGAVNEVLRIWGGLISYAGHGVIVAVSNSPSPLASGEIESEVQQRLDERNSEYDNGTPLDIEVSIGNPIQLNFSDMADVPKIIERVIARAERRSIIKHDAPPGVNIHSSPSRS